MSIWLKEKQTENYFLNWRIKEVIYKKQTKYQDLEILDLYEYGKTLVLDGAIQVTEEDEYIYNEMITHIPLSIHSNPKDVLIIGGGDGGALREVLKYKCVKTVDLVEIDEDVILAS